MIIGRFGSTTGRPYMKGRLYLPRLGISGRVSFLVDTGADQSMLMPADAIRLRVPYDQLRGDSEAYGIGGSVHSYVERARIMFTEPDVALHGYEIDLDIVGLDPAMIDYTSLLGRDVIDRWQMTYDPAGVGLKARVRSADFTINLRTA